MKDCDIYIISLIIIHTLSYVKKQNEYLGLVNKEISQHYVLTLRSQ